jgi:ankyrin repeat protein
MTIRTGAAELFAAIKKGDEAAVRRLAEADPGLLDEREGGVTPLLTAYYYGQSEVAEWLRSTRPPRDVFEAAAAGDAERVRQFVARTPSLANAYAEDGFHPLGLAAFFKRPEAVRVLLEAGADPSAPSRNPMKVTALHSAVADGGHREIAKMLIAAGADPNVKQRHGWNPLHGAAHMNDPEIVRLLLDKGARIDDANDDGKTALALAREAGHEQVAALLTERGAKG